LSRLVFANVTANPTYVDIDARAWAGEIYLQYEVTKKLNFSLGSIITNQYAINEAANRDSQGISFNWLTTTNPDYFKVYDNSENWYSAYFQTDYQPFKFLKIDVGGQVNKAGDSPLNFVPRLNTVFNWQEKLYAKLIYGQAFRSPSINERYSNVTVIHSGFVPALVGGGSSLKPETITSSEIQLAYKHSKFQFTATYFNNQQNDLVTNSLPSDSLVIANAGEVGKKLATPKIINRGSLFSEGIELEGKTTSFRNFYLTTSASFFNIEKAGGMPNSMFKLGITYELPKTGLQIGIFNSYFGKGNEIATQFKAANPEVSAYNSLSANLNFSLKKFYVGARNMPDVIFNIYGTNLLDEQIYYVESTRRIINSLQGRAGRMIYASIAIKL
jgi:outer membrane receptor for ferrienterochelin and colicin